MQTAIAVRNAHAMGGSVGPGAPTPPPPTTARPSASKKGGAAVVEGGMRLNVPLPPSEAGVASGDGSGAAQQLLSVPGLLTKTLKPTTGGGGGPSAAAAAAAAAGTAASQQLPSPDEVPPGGGGGGPLTVEQLQARRRAALKRKNEEIAAAKAAAEAAEAERLAQVQELEAWRLQMGEAEANDADAAALMIRAGRGSAGLVAMEGEASGGVAAAVSSGFGSVFSGYGGGDDDDDDDFDGTEGGGGSGGVMVLSPLPPASFTAGLGLPAPQVGSDGPASIPRNWPKSSPTVEHGHG